MQNSPKKTESQNKNISEPKKTQLILHKINIKEKPILKKYITQSFRDPEKFFISKYANKLIVINKFKSPDKIFELPLPQNLLKRYKGRRNKALQIIDDTSMKEQIADMVSVLNSKNNRIRERKRKENAEIKKDRDDKREITDQEIQKIFADFEVVRNINKKRINNFITKNEYVDLMYTHKNNNENNNEKNNDEEINKKKQENEEIDDDMKTKKLIKSKSSITIRRKNNNKKEDIQKRKISSKVIKFNDVFNNNINITKKKNSDIQMPKIPEKFIKKSNTFATVFDDAISKKIPLNKNEDYNLTANSQYSTLYRSRNKTFLSNIRNTYNKLQETTGQINPEELLIKKQYQYTMDTNSKIIKKEFVKKLAIQEKALNHNRLQNKKNNNMMKYLANKLNKEKKDLIFSQVEDYQIMKDIKYNLQNYIERKFPEYTYKWKNYLRNNSEKCHYNKINNTPREKVRNPCNSACRINSLDKKFGEEEKKYIKQNVMKNDYRKFIKDLSMTKGNFKGLLIEGKNLLKCEKDLIKRMKGKKYLINYNSSLQEKDINDVLYTYNININNF